MLHQARFSSKIRNVHYEQDIHYAMQMCRWILKPIGVWRVIYDSTKSEKLSSIILILLCTFTFSFILIPAGTYILFVKDITVKVKLFGPVGFGLSSVIKYCLLGARRATIRRCIKHLESDWRAVRCENYRAIMLRNAAAGRKVALFCMIFLYVGGTSYHTIMPLFGKTKTNDNDTNIKPLVYPGYDSYFNPQASPAYEILFCVHILFALITFNVTTAACSLAASFTTHACGQIQILMILLNDLVDGKVSGNNTVEKRMSAIAKHHIRILRFTASVEEVLREICLIELVAATLIICLLEYYCLTEWANNDTVAILTYFILLISFTFNILIFCYIGELLVEEYNKIGSTAYEINWYDLPGHKALDLVLIITMSHYPPKLTAGKICALSLNTFSAVLKTSVVYLNLLRTVTK